MLQQQFHVESQKALEIMFKVYRIDDNSQIEEIFKRTLAHSESIVTNKFHLPMNKQAFVVKNGLLFWMENHGVAHACNDYYEVNLMSFDLNTFEMKE